MDILVVGVLLSALAADPTHDQSSTKNNAANRAAEQAPSESQEMAQVPGGKATPKSEWRSGDLRGKRKLKQQKKQRSAPAAQEAKR
jgi:hypothetical protein